MKKQIKQLATSKRVAFLSLLNTGFLITQIEQLTLLRHAVNTLLGGHRYAEEIGLAVIGIATIGMIWTKLYDDAKHIKQD